MHGLSPPSSVSQNVLFQFKLQREREEVNLLISYPFITSSHLRLRILFLNACRCGSSSAGWILHSLTLSFFDPSDDRLLSFLLPLFESFSERSSFCFFLRIFLPLFPSFLPPCLSLDPLEGTPSLHHSPSGASLPPSLALHPQ
mmetsp:Transcript_13690/g.27234  ORF Transcript_13690/g.27234 Transcript_13690/m.27234 type:complete len:143 (-) Transcript_13690:817-1245(-)